MQENTIQLAAQLRHAWRPSTGLRHDYPWSLPTCATMFTGLGISCALGSGEVPV